MDDQELPTAEELGVDELEYTRILRDLQQRGLGGDLQGLRLAGQGPCL